MHTQMTKEISYINKFLGFAGLIKAAIGHICPSQALTYFSPDSIKLSSATNSPTIR